MTGSFSNLVLGGLALFGEEEIAYELPSICRRVDQGLIAMNPTLENIAQECNDRIVLLATGMQALCKEAALKIVELTAGQVMAMPETFLGFRHGAIGFLRESTPILCFLSNDPDKRRYEEDVIEDLRAKGLGRLVIIGETNVLISARDWSIPAGAPGLPDGLRTPFEIPVAQLLAYHLSVAAQVDPDNPSPDGTITRVVRPFRIHPDKN
jgi:tagatose-6-phosphate ketose/aldose isomerase